MSTAADRYGPAVIACWACWEALRRLGFAAADLFVVVHATPTLPAVCAVELRTQGLTFLMDAAPCDGPAFGLAFTRFAAALAAGEIPETLLYPAWEASEPCTHGVDLILALRAKGLVIPIQGAS